MPDAAILLSTYNGERFLSEYLASLSQQSFDRIVLYIRDDCSTDGTKSLLERTKFRFPIIPVPGGRRLGPARSFLTLMEAASGRHGSYHFADQDDIWLPERVRTAHDAVTSRISPMLFHAPPQPVNVGGDPIGAQPTAKVPSFANALVENCVVGCTSAMNDSAAKLVIQGAPRRVAMHDWWSYLVVSSFGEIQTGPRPEVLYRQHGGNLVGANFGLSTRITGKIARLCRRGLRAPPVMEQLAEFLRIHGNSLRSDHRSTVASIIACQHSLHHRVKVAMRPPFHRHSPIDQVLLRLALVLGRA